MNMLTGQNTPSQQQSQSKKASPFVCNMSVMTPEERTLHAEIGQKIFGSVEEIKELRDGYALRLSKDSTMMLTVAHFIDKERLCCPFMKFTIEVEEEHGPIWMKITGRRGAKEFIREEFDLGSLIK
jgi:hypothetical protein